MILKGYVNNCGGADSLYERSALIFGRETDCPVVLGRVVVFEQIRWKN